MKQIFVLNGSASEQSSNQLLINQIVRLSRYSLKLTIFSELKALPHFDPQLTLHDIPPPILALRKQIEMADGLLICTPEYIFSLPSGLKNAIEWCISTTIFSEKPTALITASAQGEAAHKQLQLIMETAMAKFVPETTLLIQGVKGKFDAQGRLIDAILQDSLNMLISGFIKLMDQ